MTLSALFPRLGRSGSAALEFAIVSPVAIALVLLVVQFGWSLMIDTALNYGGVVGARLGTTGADIDSNLRDTVIANAVLSMSGNMMQSANLTVSEQSYASAAAYAASGSATIGAGSSGQFVVYTLTYRQSAFGGALSNWLGMTPINHTTTIAVQNEAF